MEVKTLKQLSEDLLNNDIFMFEFLSEHNVPEGDYKLIKKDLLSNEFFLKKVLLRNPDILLILSNELREKYYDQVVSSHKDKIIKLASENKKTDEFLLKAIKSDPRNYEFLSKEKKKEMVFINSLIKSVDFFDEENISLLKEIPEEVYSDVDTTMRVLIGLEGKNFRFLSEKYKKAFVFQMESVKLNVENLKYCDKEFLKKEENLIYFLRNKKSFNDFLYKAQVLNGFSMEAITEKILNEIEDAKSWKHIFPNLNKEKRGNISIIKKAIDGCMNYYEFRALLDVILPLKFRATLRQAIKGKEKGWRENVKKVIHFDEMNKKFNASDLSESPTIKKHKI